MTEYYKIVPFVLFNCTILDRFSHFGLTNPIRMVYLVFSRGGGILCHFK